MKEALQLVGMLAVCCTAGCWSITGWSAPNRLKVGPYIGGGIEHAHDTLRPRFQVGSNGVYTDLQLARTGGGAYGRAGYAFGNAELFAGLEMAYRMRQDQSALLRFPLGASIDSVREENRQQWEVAIRPALRVVKGTHLFARAGLQRTMGRLSYRNAAQSVYFGKKYQVQSWLWGVGMESRFTPQWSVVLEYQHSLGSMVRWSQHEPWVIAVTQAMGPITGSADNFRFTPQSSAVSLGIVWYMG